MFKHFTVLWYRHEVGKLKKICQKHFVETFFEKMCIQ